jgi:outer membrane translocation and assembly module TamA
VEDGPGRSAAGGHRSIGDSWAAHLDDLRSDTGTGIWINSPFGLFRLDAGYQLTPIDGLRVDGERADRRWRIHVSLGHIF